MSPKHRSTAAAAAITTSIKASTIPAMGSTSWDQWACDHPLHKAIHGQGNAALTEQRVNQLVSWICQGLPRFQRLRICSEQWGVSSRRYDTIHAMAVKRMREQFDAQRADFVAEKLGQLEDIYRRAYECGQLSAAVGALKMALRVAGADTPS